MAIITRFGESCVDFVIAMANLRIDQIIRHCEALQTPKQSKKVINPVILSVAKYPQNKKWIASLVSLTRNDGVGDSSLLESHSDS